MNCRQIWSLTTLSLQQFIIQVVDRPLDTFFWLILLLFFVSLDSHTSVNHSWDDSQDQCILILCVRPWATAPSTASTTPALTGWTQEDPPAPSRPLPARAWPTSASPVRPGSGLPPPGGRNRVYAQFGTNARTTMTGSAWVTMIFFSTVRKISPCKTLPTWEVVIVGGLKRGGMKFTPPPQGLQGLPPPFPFLFLMQIELIQKFRSSHPRAFVSYILLSLP